MAERRYSLVAVSGYGTQHWRIRIYPEDKKDVRAFVREEVRGEYKLSSWINPELAQKGYGIFSNSDFYCLNLMPSIAAKDKTGKDIFVEGNVLFLRYAEKKVNGLTIDDLNTIISGYYPELKQIRANMCYEDLDGKLPGNKDLIKVDKDTF